MEQRSKEFILKGITARTASKAHNLCRLTCKGSRVITCKSENVLIIRDTLLMPVEEFSIRDTHHPTHV